VLHVSFPSQESGKSEGIETLTGAISTGCESEFFGLRWHPPHSSLTGAFIARARGSPFIGAKA
jgi:hypothetical protein